MPHCGKLISIQTMWADNVESAPGSVSQVRAGSHMMLTNFRQAPGLFGESLWAMSPKTAPELPDPVSVEPIWSIRSFNFEGERRPPVSHPARGQEHALVPADEIGVFRDDRRQDWARVLNPSAFFYPERGSPAPGRWSCGCRGHGGPFAGRVSGACCPARRIPSRAASVVGWDGGRLADDLAVPEARCGILSPG